MVAPGAIAEVRNHVQSLGSKLDRTREEITPAVEALLGNATSIPLELQGIVKDLMLQSAIATTSALSVAHFTPLRRWLDGAGVADANAPGTACLTAAPGVATAAGQAGGTGLGAPTGAAPVGAVPDGTALPGAVGLSARDGGGAGAPAPEGVGTLPSPRHSAHTRPLDPGAEVSAAKVLVSDGEL